MASNDPFTTASKLTGSLMRFRARMAEAGFTGFKRMAEAKRTIELVLPKLVAALNHPVFYESSHAEELRRALAFVAMYAEPGQRDAILATPDFGNPYLGEDQWPDRLSCPGSIEEYGAGPGPSEEVDSEDGDDLDSEDGMENAGKLKGITKSDDEDTDEDYRPKKRVRHSKVVLSEPEDSDVELSKRERKRLGTAMPKGVVTRSMVAKTTEGSMAKEAPTMVTNSAQPGMTTSGTSSGSSGKTAEATPGHQDPAATTPDDHTHVPSNPGSALLRAVASRTGAHVWGIGRPLALDQLLRFHVEQVSQVNAMRVAYDALAISLMGTKQEIARTLIEMDRVEDDQFRNSIGTVEAFEAAKEMFPEKDRELLAKADLATLLECARQLPPSVQAYNTTLAGGHGSGSGGKGPEV
ncbi:hypothetical protein FA13DRAFT_1795005 [Coprinellus micaceus]|uniref:Uncharacterized protein n=1 Tax=Coprinellus micaceus TaxID=71717 RepID=A0A4Y7SZX1_COPMI|nr:hypothetical protein FA13DRAFT_1795005 [Coprinellus micaceus]